MLVLPKRQSSTDLAVANMENSRNRYSAYQKGNSERDIRYVFKFSVWVLGSIGIWPVVIRGIGHYVAKIAFVVCNFVLGFAIVPCILHMIYDVKDINIRLKLCGVLGFCSTAILKYLALTIRRSKILRCIEHVKSDWCQVKLKSDRKLMRDYASTGRKLSAISATSMYLAGLIYHTILPFFSERKIENNHTIRPLVYPTYSKLYQAQTSPTYEIVYMLHLMCGYTMYSVTIGSCGMAAVFATHVCGQIEIIACRLEELPRSKASDLNQRLAAIVKSHVRILRFTAAVDEILREVSLLEFLSSVFTMCFPEYFCLVDLGGNDTIGLMTYFMLFVSFCFNMFILCYIGELLVEKSSQIGSMCFSIDWYQLPPKSVRGLVLVIAMSSNPIKLSAGGLMDISLATFGNVLKTNLAYVSLLRTMVI